MKECLNCKKHFEAKRESAKFCSANCRVKWHYKQEGRVKKENVVQMQVVMNTILEMVGKINQQPAPTFYEAPKVTDLKRDEPMFPAKPKIRRSYENYKQLKLDCESVEAWLELKEEIIASGLPESQKNLLIN